MQTGVDLLFGVVDAVGVGEGGLFVGDNTDDVGALVVGQLDGEEADTTGGCVDDNPGFFFLNR